MEIHHMDKWKHTPQKMAFHILKFEVGSQAANQFLNKGHHETPLWVKQTHAQQLGGLLANMMHLVLPMIRHKCGDKCSESKSVCADKHCIERLLAQVYTVHLLIDIMIAWYTLSQ